MMYLNKKVGKGRKKRHLRKLGKRFAIFLALISAIGLSVGLYRYVQYQQTLPFYPPTNLVGHIETYPGERISFQPIPVAQQKHILEHTPNGEPGVIIQFNCEQFDCPENLINNLISITEEYPNVYLAPHSRLAKMLSLSALGKLELLEYWNEDQIYGFLQSHFKAQSRSGF